MSLPVEPAPNAIAPTQRPTGVTVLGALAIAAGALAAAGGFILLALGTLAGAAGVAGADADMAWLGVLAVFGALAGVALLLYAAFAFLVAYGLFSRKRWAWYAALILAALQILQGLGSLVGLELVSALLGLGIGGFVAWYLLSPPVQAWFGVSHGTPWNYDRRAA